MNSMLKRTLTFFIAVPVIFGIVFLLPHFHFLAFNLIVIAASFLGTYEIAVFFKKNLNPISAWTHGAMGSVLPVIAYLESANIITVDIFFIVLVVMTGLIFVSKVYKGEKHGFEHLLSETAASLFIVVYPGVFLSYLIRISALVHPSFLLILLIALVFGNDAGAYVFGMAFGRNNAGILKVSPNKSIAGFAGGIFSSLLIAGGFYFFIPDLFRNSWVFALTLALVIGVLTIAGDLFESALKRSANIKDSGTVVPGRGGMLDSADSMILSAPFFYYLFLFIQQGLI
jgi:phosphatidate cytidylyltransferase